LQNARASETAAFAAETASFALSAELEFVFDPLPGSSSRTMLNQNKSRNNNRIAFPFEPAAASLAHQQA
jgi:hypothetical protein